MSAVGTLLPSANAAACPQLVDADIRVLNEESGFDPKRSSAPLTGCKIPTIPPDRSSPIRYPRPALARKSIRAGGDVLFVGRSAADDRAASPSSRQQKQQTRGGNHAGLNTPSGSDRRGWNCRHNRVGDSQAPRGGY